jgi:hypothetical protein
MILSIVPVYPESVGMCKTAVPDLWPKLFWYYYKKSCTKVADFWTPHGYPHPCNRHSKGMSFSVGAVRALLSRYKKHTVKLSLGLAYETYFLDHLALA